MNYSSAARQPSPAIHAWDLAEFFIRESGRPIDAMKLQKLCYYAQAWSLAWGRGAIFPEHFQAWENGPVIRELFARHRGQFMVSTVDGNADLVYQNASARSTAMQILKSYGKYSGKQLSRFTHEEEPWKRTREIAKCKPGDFCDEEIDNGIIMNFFKKRLAPEPELLPF